MDKFETDFLIMQKLQTFVWFRYIDDMFFIKIHVKEELESFMKELNKFSDHIKVTFESNKENLNFLDVNINLSHGHLMTNMYIKATECHKYLDYLLSYPIHTKRSIVYSQSLRDRRLFSLQGDVLKHCTKMKSWFLERRYSENMIGEEMKKVKFLKKGSKNPMDLKQFHLWLHTTPLFSPGPMVSFRSVRKISSYLVRAKSYHLERIVGSMKKKRRGKVCTNATEIYTFSSTVTGETFQMNHELSCEDKCLIYLLKGKVHKKQYAGETTDGFRLKWSNYKVNDRKFQRNKSCNQQHLYVHFYSEGRNRFLGNVSVSLIDKTDSFEPMRRENYQTKTLNTLAPLGPNIDSAV